MPSQVGSDEAYQSVLKPFASPLFVSRRLDVNGMDEAVKGSLGACVFRREAVYLGVNYP
jgi:hypothetical protein